MRPLNTKLIEETGEPFFDGCTFRAGVNDARLGQALETIRMSLACPSVIAALDATLCTPVDIYCERTSAALDAEPINALTNVALPFAAWMAWRCRLKQPTSAADGVVRVLIVIIAIVGLGSFLFHTVATRWAQWGDVIPILAFTVLYLWLVLSRFLRWSFWPVLLALSCFLISTLYAEAWVPPEVLWGGAMYLPTLFSLIALSIALHRQESAAGKSMLSATGAFVCAFAARTLDMQVCNAFPFGTHFLWHLLTALFLYLLTRLAILHMPASFPEGAHRT